MTIDELLALITSQHAGKPRFRGMVSLNLTPVVEGTEVIESIPASYDIDTAVGAQLDVDGEWIGRSRRIPVPVEGLYFEFDSPSLGFDQGYWRGPYDSEIAIVALDDETYRQLLRGKIAANSWNGQVDTAQTIVQRMLDVDGAGSGTYVDGWTITDDDITVSTDEPITGGDEIPVPLTRAFVIDNMDMSMDIGIAGRTPSRLVLALLDQRYLPVNPAGVRSQYLVASSSGTSVFGFDVSNQFIGGFDEGSWGLSPSQMLSL